MVTVSANVSVDAAGVVTVSTGAPAGDYFVRAAAEGAVATATIRVLPRATGYMVFDAIVGSDHQIFIRDFSKDTVAAQLTSGFGFVGGLAADGTTKSIFFARGNVPSSDIYRIQFDGTGLVNLTNDAASSNQGPTIDPVSHDVFFSRKVGTVVQIVRMHQDGSSLTTVTGGVQSKVNPNVSPDGQWLAWGEAYQPGFNQEIVTSRITGADTVRLTNRTGIDGLAVWLTNTRVLWQQFGTPTDLFVATAQAGADAVNVTNSATSESSPGRACSNTKFTFISTSGTTANAVEGDVDSPVLVKYGLGYKPSLVRRVC
jgi:hypothetical protein